MGLTTAQQIAILTVLIMGYGLVHMVLLLLGHRLKTSIRRHDIIAGARRRRQEYLQAVAVRAAQVAGADLDGMDPGQFNVDIVDDDDDGARLAA